MEDDVLRELKKITKILILSNTRIIEAELEKIVSTNDRKKMWMLIDGNRGPQDIAKQIGITPQAVSKFLLTAKAAELIDYSRNIPPRKILDYVPPSWLELIETPVTPEQTSKKKSIDDSKTNVGDQQ
jgi:hypothetical protein